MKETWRDITKWPGYKASSFGRIRSSTGKILASKSHTNGGYRAITVYFDKVFRSDLIHRLVLEAFRGPCPRCVSSGLGSGGDHHGISSRISGPRILSSLTTPSTSSNLSAFATTPSSVTSYFATYLLTPCSGSITTNTAIDRAFG